MSTGITPGEWTSDEALEAAVTFLSTAVAGLPDADDGSPISTCGVGANCSAAFQNQTFALRDYCWCNGELHPETTDWQSRHHAQAPPSGGTSSGCPVNFEHFGSGIKGTWYKRLGRDVEFSRAARPGEAIDLLLNCLISIRPEHARRWASTTRPGGGA